MNAIQISIRELHAHTGRYIEKANSEQRVIITHRGKPVAEIKPYVTEQKVKRTAWDDRYLTPAFRKLQESGTLQWPKNAPDITELISEERDRETL